MTINYFFRDNPAERLGYQKGGISEIQKHKYVKYSIIIYFIARMMKLIMKNVL